MASSPSFPQYAPHQTETLEEAIRAAIAEADKGIFVSSEAVHRWMDSWDNDDELPIPEPDVFSRRLCGRF
jgi:predicted transcriptional regulator